jgi:hypothetical protein
MARSPLFISKKRSVGYRTSTTPSFCNDCWHGSSSRKRKSRHTGTAGPIGSSQSCAGRDNLPVGHDELAFWRLMAYVVVPIDFFGKDTRMRKLMFRFGRRSAALPIHLWCLAAQESPRDGRLAEHSTEMLETALGWTGRRGELEEALIEAGFLEKMPAGYQVLNWEQDQGHIWRNHVRASKAATALHGRNTVDAASTAMSTA